jgi:hypothetical protein
MSEQIQIETAIREKILSLLAQRKIGSSICPSDAPRSLYVNWRDYMPATRLVAAQLASEGLIIVTQGENIIFHEQLTEGSIKGPIRLRFAPKISLD